MISQYNKDGAFLHRALRMGILTIVAKDNIDKSPKQPLQQGTTKEHHYLFSSVQKKGTLV